MVNRQYIYENHLKRQGKCLRCGACCKLMFKTCPCLKMEPDGKYICIKHESFRLPNCKIFPVDFRDINDRNIISTEKCGYYFV
jgi:hypothetical protein